MPNETSK